MPKWASGLGFLVAVTVLCSHGPLHAQPVFSPDSEFGPYAYQTTFTLNGEADDAFGRIVAISGDVALVAGSGIVYVFERDPQTDVWQQVAPITPTGEVAGFARALAFDRNTTVIGSQGLAHLFRRGAGGQWREIATLRPSDGHPNFGASVAIAGNQVIVGATAFSIPGRVGTAYIFRRESPGSAIWNEVAIRVSSQTGEFPRSNFGGIVAITRNTAIITDAIGPMTAAANIFSRDLGGPDGWGLAARPAFGNPASFAGGVAIDRDTVVLGQGEIFPSALILGRNVGGPDNWGLRTIYGAGGSVCCGTFGSVQVDDSRIILGLTGLGTGVDILSRNQGGSNAWQRIARFREAPLARLGADVSIGGDTALLGAPGSANDPADNVVHVLVSDLDGDGIRDGIDQCPRDPLNNVVGDCQRTSAAHPVLDDLIAQESVTTETQANRHTITATYTNVSATAVRNPFFEVTELTGRNVLLNADEGRGRLGATLSPDVGDGVLSPGESTTVTFRIRLRTDHPYQFFVAFHGDPVEP
jgi:hypothetical protein